MEDTTTAVTVTVTAVTPDDFSKKQKTHTQPHSRLSHLLQAARADEAPADGPAARAAPGYILAFYFGFNDFGLVAQENTRTMADLAVGEEARLAATTSGLACELGNALQAASEWLRATTAPKEQP
jgi:hypothetical protein